MVSNIEDWRDFKCCLDTDVCFYAIFCIYVCILNCKKTIMYIVFYCICICVLKDVLPDREYM